MNPEFGSTLPKLSRKLKTKILSFLLFLVYKKVSKESGLCSTSSKKKTLGFTLKII